MVTRVTFYAAALVSSLSFSGTAFAADAPKAFVCGPANGTNVVLSTAAQKQPIERQTEGRSVFYKPKVLPLGMLGGVLSPGAPGVERAPSTKSGR